MFVVIGLQYHTNENPAEAVYGLHGVMHLQLYQKCALIRATIGILRNSVATKK